MRCSWWRLLKKLWGSGEESERVSLDHSTEDLVSLLVENLNGGQLPARERSEESQEHVIGNQKTETLAGHGRKLDVTVSCRNVESRNGPVVCLPGYTPYAEGAAWFLHYWIIKCERRRKGGT